MRIIAGKWRGMGILQPPGTQTRPTTDRVREAMFSALESRLDFDGICVLDAFAGSGALGLEALSRGAGRAVFCERDGKALSTIRRNLAALPGAEAASEVVRGDVLKHPPVHDMPFDLVLLDPPYAYPAQSIARFLGDLEAAGSLVDAPFVCYEHAKKDSSAVKEAFSPIQWQSLGVKCYGDIAFDVFRRLR